MVPIFSTLNSHRSRRVITTVSNRRNKMHNSFVTDWKYDQGHDDSSKNEELSDKDGTNYSELMLKKLTRKVNPWHALILKVFGLSNKIPRHVVTLDEKYLRRCLESIHVDAANAARRNIYVNLSSLNMRIVSDGLSSAKIEDEYLCDFDSFVFDCPLEVETGSVVVGPADHSIVGSIMGSRSMANILNSPLLKKFGAFDVDSSSNDVKGSMISSDCTSSFGGSETVQERLVSESSSNTTCSDNSFSNSTTIQGMLQCTWKDGNPNFVFSLDNTREVYVANLSNEGSDRNKGSSYTYLFRSRKGSHKEHGISDNELHLVGKMKVSTSFSIDPLDSKIMETEFVLFGGDEICNPKMQSSSHNDRKNKGISKKVAKVFKSGPLSKQRTMTRFRRSRSVSLIEVSSSDPCQDTINNFDALDGTHLLDEQLPSNFQLIAIVTRDRLPDNPHPGFGGWGLKFLGKKGVRQQKMDDCSTDMDIIVPAGIHGGPRIRNGGPSSLVERWRSGGYCDCGGWDLGCPLTVHKSGLSKRSSSPIETSDECKFFDFFVQGPEHNSPTLSISNVHDGLYFVRFGPTLSALQSFSIAVAYVHTRSPTLGSRNVQQSRW